jgi:predicted alpha/beta-fold hydrolase
VPIITESSYRPSFLFRNRHVNTIVHALLRQPKASYTRERVITPDSDFVDLDFSFASKSDNSKTVVLLIHGLEGNSKSGYVKGMINACNSHGWDGVVLNFRGCSGEDNKSFGSYHSGQTEDISLVVDYLKQTHQYDTIFLVSYSLGANAMLKYLGEDSVGKNKVSGSVAISAPCHLEDCAIQLEKWYNKAYMIAFLRSLRKKVKGKCKAHPNHNINLKAVLKASTFLDFDNEFTARAHGFKDAKDYWMKSSSIQFLSKIDTPTLLINAQDDPFLTPSCFPFKEAEASKYFHLETPIKGGHVGFVSNILLSGNFWHEKRSLEFLWKQIRG